MSSAGRHARLDASTGSGDSAEDTPTPPRGNHVLPITNSADDPPAALAAETPPIPYGSAPLTSSPSPAPVPIPSYDDDQGRPPLTDALAWSSAFRYSPFTHENGDGDPAGPGGYGPVESGPADPRGAEDANANHSSAGSDPTGVAPDGTSERFMTRAERKAAAPPPKAQPATRREAREAASGAFPKAPGAQGGTATGLLAPDPAPTNRRRRAVEQVETGTARSRGRGLLGWTLLGCGLLAFAGVFIWMATGASSGVDGWIHDAFITHRVEWLNGWMIAVSAIFGTVPQLFLCLVIAASFWFVGERRSALVFAGAMFAALAITTVMKYVVARDRPPAFEWIGPMEDPHASFPSGHTAHTAVLLLVAGYLWWRLRPTASRMVIWLSASVLVTALVMASRMYLGVHWFTDTLASVCLAIAIFGIVMVLIPPPPRIRPQAAKP